MKTLSRIILSLFAVALLSACGGIGSKKMDSLGAAELALQTYQKYVDTENYKPISIWWSEREELSNNMEYLYLSMVGTDGKLYTQAIKVGGDYKGPNDIEPSRSSRTYDFATLKGITEADIDPALILSQMDNAKSQIPVEFKFKSIGRFDISMDVETGEKEVTFTVLVTEKGNATSVEGGNFVTTYYEVEFYGLPDGTAIMEEVEYEEEDDDDEEEED